MDVSVAAMLLGWVAGWWLLWRVPRLGRTANSGLDADRSAHTAADDPDVAVIIPARDEALSLPNLLESLERQTLRPLEIIVVDDDSSDGTGDLARAFEGVTVLDGAPLPPGWTGKAWACAQGAATATASQLVFLDADVRVAPGGLAEVVAERNRRGGLLSVQPYHRMERTDERFSALFNIVGVMGVGMASPGREGRARAAFGPCIACRREDYEAIGGHEAVRGEIIEDIALGRAFARGAYPVHALGGGDQVSFRMYPRGLPQLIEGWSKNMASGAGSSGPLRLIGVALWITAVLTSVSLLIELVAGTGHLSAIDVAVAWALFSVQFAVMLRQLGNFGRWPVLAFPATTALFVVVFVRSLWLTLVRRRVSWRGRPIPLSRTRRWSPVSQGEGA